MFFLLSSYQVTKFLPDYSPKVKTSVFTLNLQSSTWTLPSLISTPAWLLTVLLLVLHVTLRNFLFYLQSKHLTEQHLY